MRTVDPPTTNAPGELLGEAGTKGNAKGSGLFEPAIGADSINTNAETPGLRKHVPDTFSITRRFTGRPVDVVVGTMKLWAPPQVNGIWKQIGAAKGKFAGLSAATVGTGFALVPSATPTKRKEAALPLGEPLAVEVAGD